MGQKGCPIGFRTGVTKKWRSLWYGNNQEFGKFLIEDVKIRDFLRKKPFHGFPFLSACGILLSYLKGGNYL